MIAKQRYRDLAHQRESSPIPTPSGRWIMGQRWEDLLFCSWPVPVDAVRLLVSPALTIDTIDGSAWVSAVPFFMEDAHFRGVPPLPFISSFPEVNLRTYVSAGGHAGVWFLSLDTESRINVLIARTAFHAPYFYARVSMERGERIRFRSERPGGEAAFEVDYRAEGASAEPHPGTLEHFLTERYSMFCSGRGGAVYRGDIQHAPWGIGPATMDLRRNDLSPAMGLDVAGRDPVVFYSAATEVILWRPVRI